MKKYIKYLIWLGVIVFVVVGLNWPTNDNNLKGKFNIEISIKDYGIMKFAKSISLRVY